MLLHKQNKENIILHNIMPEVLFSATDHKQTLEIQMEEAYSRLIYQNNWDSSLPSQGEHNKTLYTFSFSFE